MYLGAAFGSRKDRLFKNIRPQSSFWNQFDWSTTYNHLLLEILKLESKEMTKYTLKEPADLSVYYAADMIRYTPDYLKSIGVTKEAFLEYYGVCPSVGFFADEKQIGGVIYDPRLNEVHIAILPEYYGRWGRLFAQAIGWIFTGRDMVFGCVDHTNLSAIHFMERNRFEPVGEHRGTIKYKMTANMVRHRRDIDLHCPSTLATC